MNKNLTLAQLGNIKPSPVTADDSRLVRTIKELIFNKKAKDLSTEDLRILIGQKESLAVTVPLALEILSDNPLAEGDFYPGDLLKSVLNVPGKFWLSNPEHKKAMEEILHNNESKVFDADLSDDIKEELRTGFDNFSSY